MTKTCMSAVVISVMAMAVIARATPEITVAPNVRFVQPPELASHANVPASSPDASFKLQVTVEGTSAGKPFTVALDASEYTITAKPKAHAIAIDLLKNDKLLPAFGKSPTINKVTLNFKPVAAKGETRTLNFTKVSVPTAAAKSDGAIHFTFNFGGMTISWTTGGKTSTDQWDE